MSDIDTLTIAHRAPDIFADPLGAIVHAALKPLSNGRLQIDLPEGDTWVFGAGGKTGRSARIRVIKRVCFRKAVLGGDLGFLESYMDGDWETDDIDAVTGFFTDNAETSPSFAGTSNEPRGVAWLSVFNRVAHRLRANTISGSRKNIQDHYDLSNELFSLILDPSMTYSCAVFEKPDQELEAAQLAKYDRILSGAGVRPGDRLIEIGCGWGGLSERAATKFGARVTAVTISQRQYDFARERFAKAGLSDRIDLRLTDYRALKGKFDHVVSIEMIEAVGHEFLPAYFAKIADLLEPDGIASIQAILYPDSRYETVRKRVDFIQKHIFPGSMIPSLARITEVTRRHTDLSLHEIRDMGSHYGRTLDRWRQSFRANIPAIKALGFDDRFIRKWELYFAYCKAGFDYRHITVSQLHFTRPNNRRLAVAGGVR